MRIPHRIGWNGATAGAHQDLPGGEAAFSQTRRNHLGGAALRTIVRGFLARLAVFTALTHPFLAVSPGFWE